MPGPVTRAASPAACPSPSPQMTGNPAGRPVSPAAWAVTLPNTAAGGCSAGSCQAVTPVAASTGAAHCSACMSNRPSGSALPQPVASRPVSRWTRYPCTSAYQRAAAKTSGSCRASQTSLPTARLAERGRPVSAWYASRPRRCSSSGSKSLHRSSSHRRAGRSGSPSASRGMNVSRWCAMLSPASRRTSARPDPAQAGDQRGPPVAGVLFVSASPRHGQGKLVPRCADHAVGHVPGDDLNCGGAGVDADDEGIHEGESIQVTT